ncbi:MAG: outer membrane beta-barrel protein [Steroidobacteraceae bacterium]|jgi:TonB-dependent receptor|nr:outer membrane beta-barrel protein [Steroidobacteraceae bacterium]
MNIRVRNAVHATLAGSALAAVTGLVPHAWAQEGPDAGAVETVLEEIVVTARQRSAATDVLVERIEQPVVMDLVSAEQISRVGDSTVALALRRLPGVTLVGDFIYIRGLGERYSSTTLNGAYVPSPDLTRNVIPLDIFPAEVIDSISIQKGYTVDRPAAFGGGNVDIRTTKIPDSFKAQVQIGSGWNSDLSGDVLSYKGGSDDEWGTDDGTRALPGAIEQAIPIYRGSFSIIPMLQVIRRENPQATTADAELANRQLATSLNRNVDLTSESPDPDISVEASIGNTWTLDEAALWKFGFVAVGDYKSQWRNRDRINRSSTTPDVDNGQTQRSINQVALTGSLSAGVSFAEDHTVGLTALFLRNTDDESALTQRNNFNFRREDGTQLRDYRTRYEERELELLQFNGRHVLGQDTIDALGWDGFDPGPLLTGLGLSWYYSNAKATTDVPNETTISAVDRVDPATGAVLSTSLRPSGSTADFRFTELEDEVNSYGWKLDRPFEFSSGAWKGSVFGGWDYYEKGRGYIQTELGLGTTSAPASSLIGTPSQVLTDEKILNPVNGWLLSLGGIGTESYLAGETIEAGYGGIDVTWNDTWRLSAGVRNEIWQQLSIPVDQLEFGGSKVPLTPDEIAAAAKQDDDWYPSAAITYMRPDFWAESFQLRFGFSQTTARPDLREVTQSSYIDPLTDARVIGNPNLIPSDITNIDLRAEWFFDSRDNLTISPFYKKIDNPIETVEGAGTDNNLSFTFINADTADLYGVEFEWFKNLAFTEKWLGGWAAGLFTAGNVTWSDSELTVGSTSFALTNDVRPLSQQSEWITNLQFGYDSPGGAHSATLAWNYYGERLFFAGRNGAADAYEQPFGSVDLVYSWYPDDRWSVKLRLQNILDDNLEIEQNGVVVLEQDIGVTYKLDFTLQF